MSPLHSAGAPAALADALALLYPESRIVPVNAGRTALRLCLRLARRRHPGRSLVVVPDYVCPSVVEAIRAEGLTPLACPTTDELVIDERAAEDMLSDACLAVVAVHMYGLAAPVESLFARARGLGIVAIDDAAQVVGSRHPDRVMLGAKGDFGLLSFALNKTVCCGASGMGGVLLVNDPGWHGEVEVEVSALAEASRTFDPWFLCHQATGRDPDGLRWALRRAGLWRSGPGRSGSGRSGSGLSGVGRSGHARPIGLELMPRSGAALARAQILRIDRIRARKTETLSLYLEAFAAAPGVRFPQLRDGRYLTRAMAEVADQDQADRLVDALRGQGIPARRPYPRLEGARTRPVPGYLELPSGPNVTRHHVARIRAQVLGLLDRSALRSAHA